MGFVLGLGNGIVFRQGGSQNWSSYWTTQEQFFESQPSSGKETSINQEAANNDRGATNVLTIGEFNNKAELHRGLIQFDLTALPDNAIIIEAKLYLAIQSNYSSNARAFYLYRMKRAWIEGTGNNTVTNDGATWNKYDGSNAWQTAGAMGANDCEATPIGVSHIVAVPAINSSVEFTITARTKAELDLGFGWLIKSETEADDLHAFYASENTSSQYRPCLTISYLTTSSKHSFLYTKSAYNPLFKGFYGSVWYNGANDLVFYYSGGTNVLRATSTDGLTWTPDATNNPVMTPLAGTIDVCQIWKEGTTWYMLYRSNEWGGVAKSIGLATSADGITWTKSASNPVMTGAGVGAWAGSQIDPWGIMKIGTVYYLWINNVNKTPRQTGLCTSTDLVNWTMNANNPIFTGDRYCVTPIYYHGYYYLFVPHTVSADATPTTGRNEIEIYRDANPTFLSTSRKLLGRAIVGGGLNAWDNTYLDTPSIITTDINRNSYPLGDEIWMYYCAKGVYGLWYQGVAIGSLNALKTLPAIG